MLLTIRACYLQPKTGACIRRTGSTKQYGVAVGGSRQVWLKIESGTTAVIVSPLTNGNSGTEIMINGGFADGVSCMNFCSVFGSEVYMTFETEKAE